MATHTITYDVNNGQSTLTNGDITVAPEDVVDFKNDSEHTVRITLPGECFDTPLTHELADGGTYTRSIKSDAAESPPKYGYAIKPLTEGSYVTHGEFVPETVTGEITVTN